MTLDPRTALLELATRIDNDGTASQIGSAEEIREIAAALPPSPAVVPSGAKEPFDVFGQEAIDAAMENERTAQQFRDDLVASPSPPALDGAGREAVIEECAKLIERNEIMDSSDGQYLRPRSDGNRFGVAYAAAIRSIKETP